MAGRRANNEGSIFQRGDGRWSASMSLGNGKRKHFLGHSWEEVHAQLVTAQKARFDGLPPVNGRQTVARYLPEWFATTRSSRKPRTNTRYEELIRLHVMPHAGSTVLGRLSPQQLQGLYAQLEAKGLSPTTVRQVHAILHKAFKQAVAWGSLVRNPADYVQTPRVQQKEMKVLTAEQAAALLDASKGTRFEALFALALTTGMRQGEILGLRWQDVELDRGVLHVRHAIQRIEGKFQFVEPKSAKSRRQLLMGVGLVDGCWPCGKSAPAPK